MGCKGILRGLINCKLLLQISQIRQFYRAKYVYINTSIRKKDDTMQGNAIEAVKMYYTSLDEKGKAEFRKETGFGDLHSISLMSPEVAEKFCTNHRLNVGFMTFPNRVRESIWTRSKEADEQKDLSAKAYDAALAAEKAAKKAQENAEDELEKVIAQYEEGDSHITDAQNKLRNLVKGTSDATLAREIAGERMVRDAKSSLMAFQSGMIADAMLGQRFNIKS